MEICLLYLEKYLLDFAPWPTDPKTCPIYQAFQDWPVCLRTAQILLCTVT